MDIYVPMSTTVRHNRITMTFSGTILDLLRKKEVHALQEEYAIVYWGTKKTPGGFEFVDVKNIDDVGHFKNVIINELDYVRPDFVLFKNNPYLENARQTRTAGQPDLIVEVWSDGNSKNDRAFLQNLYATSDITEHWYIEQDSNEVECYLGKNKIDNQYLSDVLVTRDNLKFDLRYLAD